MIAGSIPPSPARDITTPEDVAELVRRFYGDVAQDDVLGPMFNEVAQVDWAAHIPRLVQFWSRALLGIPGYQGNPYRLHASVHAQRAFRPEHFHRWLSLFHETVDDGWTGANAERAKDLARNVARVHSTQLTGEAVDVSIYEST